MFLPESMLTLFLQEVDEFFSTLLPISLSVLGVTMKEIYDSYQVSIGWFSAQFHMNVCLHYI